ncbi:MAG: hypothetical protein ACTSXC_07250, partial [Candidatus Freyarchaeota archaeon]
LKNLGYSISPFPAFSNTNYVACLKEIEKGSYFYFTFRFKRRKTIINGKIVREFVLEELSSNELEEELEKILQEYVLLEKHR